VLIDSINAALKEATSPEEAFPLVLHSQVDRVERQKVLDELSSKYRVFENNLNGVKYVFDYDIAKELFSHNESAIRYTCLITDSKSSKVKEIESYLNYFPVFSDLDSYKAVLP